MRRTPRRPQIELTRKGEILLEREPAYELFCRQKRLREKARKKQMKKKGVQKKQESESEESSEDEEEEKTEAMKAAEAAARKAKEPIVIKLHEEVIVPNFTG